MSPLIAPPIRDRRHGTPLTENFAKAGSAAVQRGFTLVELMVAMTLSLLVLVVMITLFANTSAARSEIDKSSRQIENGRFACRF